jgi:hypothetical protein
MICSRNGNALLVGIIQPRGGTPFLPLCAHFAGPGEGETRRVGYVRCRCLGTRIPLPLASIRMNDDVRGAGRGI